jgi:hypothetical protein
MAPPTADAGIVCADKHQCTRPTTENTLSHGRFIRNTSRDRERPAYRGSESQLSASDRRAAHTARYAGSKQAKAPADQ